MRSPDSHKNLSNEYMFYIARQTRIKVSAETRVLLSGLSKAAQLQLLSHIQARAHSVDPYEIAAKAEQVCPAALESNRIADPASSEGKVEFQCNCACDGQRVESNKLLTMPELLEAIIDQLRSKFPNIQLHKLLLVLYEDLVFSSNTVPNVNECSTLPVLTIGSLAIQID
jgi:hypothetical protein